MRKPIAVLLYPGCIFFEVALAVELLADSRELRYFTPDGSRHQASNGALIEPHGSYQTLESVDVDAVLIPGGNPDSIIDAGTANACLIAASRRGALLAGMCAGGLVLANAGLLKGKRATHNYTAEYASPEVVACTAPIWDGIVYEGTDVVVDGRIITALPWAYVRYAAAVASKLGDMAEAQVQQFIAYHCRSQGAGGRQNGHGPVQA